MNTTAVQTQNLTRRFGAFTAVDNITFEVHGGEIFGFLGANGAGKTTTIRMLCGLLTPTSGSGSVAGLDIATQSEQIKQQVGYMSQKFSLYMDLTVAENLHFYGGIYGLGPDRLEARKAFAIDRLGLGEFMEAVTADVPVGWRQRLALGCAILHEPRILFLDEPTGGVDPAARRNFWGLIYDLARDGTTVFVTTHYMDEAEYCNRISIMDQGRIVALGAPSQLKDENGMATIEDVFVSLISPEARSNGG